MESEVEYEWPDESDIWLENKGDIFFHLNVLDISVLCHTWTVLHHQNNYTIIDFWKMY